MKKVLVLGASGAMATYLIPELLDRGYLVKGVSLDDMTSDHANLVYVKGNAKDIGYLGELLAEGYDAVVDFMVYYTEDFEKRYRLFLDNTEHYLFFSSYRVYADSAPITEDSPLLIDVPRSDDFDTYHEYSIYKAEEERILQNSGYRHFTVVRPAITYSQCRFQLTTLEASVLLPRMRQGKTVLLPEGAMAREATMSWAGDVAKMLATILLNPKAYGETYTVSTSEHHTWREIAEMYRRIGGLEYEVVSNEDYLRIIGDTVLLKQQLLYDRCFDRIVDNSKILTLCGMTQADLMPLEVGLRMEYEALTEERLARIGYDEYVNVRMDEYLEERRK